jgi:hypothetical protein
MAGRRASHDPDTAPPWGTIIFVILVIGAVLGLAFYDNRSPITVRKVPVENIVVPKPVTEPAPRE